MSTENGIVISLFDYTGHMIAPWVEAGYRCYCVDRQHPPGETHFGNVTLVGADVREWLPHFGPVKILFAFPPCTHVAASFGQDYFFTLREAEMKPALSITTLLIFLLGLMLILNWCVSLLGLIPGLVNFSVLLVLAFYLMWNALRLGLTRLDGMLLRLPVLGPVYEACLRRGTTYFQHDTRMVFLKLMDDLVKDHVDEETSAKGIKLLSCFERQPIFEGFYKIKKRPTDGAGGGGSAQ